MSSTSTNAISDYEKLINLLNELGIGFRVESTKFETIVFCETGNKKVGGYDGFYTVFEFNSDDKFIKMGAYE